MHAIKAQIHRSHLSPIQYKFSLTVMQQITPVLQIQPHPDTNNANQQPNQKPKIYQTNEMKKFKIQTTSPREIPR